MIPQSSIIVLLTVLGVPVGNPAVAQSGPASNSLKGKKLIEWGWDEPDTKFMATVRRYIETRSTNHFRLVPLAKPDRRSPG